MEFLNLYFGILLFVLGACVGSFVNCAADRYVAKESVWKGRSHCPACGRTLGARDLIPIFSFLFLRGKCRTCGAPIPVRCLFCELAGGLIFAATYASYGPSFLTLEYLLLFSGLFAIALIDLDTMEIPDGILIYLVAVFAIFFYPHGGWEIRAREALLGAAVIGGGIWLVSLISDALLKRESLGGGDIKLFFVLSLFTGLRSGIFLLLLSCLVGLLFAAFFRRKKKGEFPFGPAIAVAALFLLLFLQGAVDWYWALIL